MFEVQDLYEWISTTQTKNVRLDLLDNDQIIPNALPQIHDQNHINLCSEEHPNHHFVLTLPRGGVIGQPGFILTPEYTVLRNPQPKNAPDFLNDQIDRTIRELPLESYTIEWLVGNVATIAAVWTYLYYHWMVEILPRLFLLKKAGIKVDTLITSPLNAPFQQETLERMGFPVSKRVEMRKDRIIRAENLIVPSIARYKVDPEVFHWVRDLFPHPKSHRRHLYISRTGATYRRILNEEELYPILEAYDFEVVRLQDKTVDQQAKLFSQAAIVLGPHGAGFTNAIFMKPGAHLVEFYAKEYRKLHFYNHIAEYTGLEYHVFWADAVPHDKNPKMDMTLSPVQLKDILEKELKLLKANR